MEICRQLAERHLRVILTARDESAGMAAAEALQAERLDVEFRRLDVSALDSIGACVTSLEADGVDVDALINNAAVMPEDGFGAMAPETLEQAMRTNALGAAWIAQAFSPGMIRRGYGRIVNMSTGWGSFAEGLEGPPAYSISKAALNAVTVALARELPESVKVNACCPGWVRTRMGGEQAPTSVEEGADTAVWLATLPDDGPTGGFFRRRRRIEW